MKRQPIDLGNNRPTRSIRLARLFSDVFSPPVIYPVFSLVLVLTTSPSWKNIGLALLYGACTALLPVIVIFRMVKQGRAEDIHVSGTDQRRQVYLVATIGAAIALILVRLLDGPLALRGLIWCNLAAMFIFWVLNRRWLVSAHMAAISLVTVLATSLYGLVAAALLPLVGLTFYFRWFLRRHTFWELIMGLVLGAAIAGCAISAGAMY